jgi:hypothetical protein
VSTGMKRKGTCAAATLSVAGAIFLSTSGPISAAEDTRAIPDFFMNGFGWHSRQANIMPPPPGAPGVRGPIRDHPDHPHVANNSGGLPTVRIGDDINPLLRPWAAEVTRAANEEVFAGGVPFSAAQRCFLPGVPGFLGFTAEPALFLQAPDMVTIVHQRGQTVRRIYLNVPHSDNPEPSWMGESVGHYEGDTLVVDTIGLNDKTFMGNFPIPHSEQLHVVERIRIVPGSPDLITDAPRPRNDVYFSDPDNKVLQIIATVEDPVAFTAPYSMMQIYELADFPMEESICPENNDDRFDQGLVPVPNDPTPDF